MPGLLDRQPRVFYREEEGQPDCSEIGPISSAYQSERPHSTLGGWVWVSTTQEVVPDSRPMLWHVSITKINMLGYTEGCGLRPAAGNMSILASLVP